MSRHPIRALLLGDGPGVSEAATELDSNTFDIVIVESEAEALQRLECETFGALFIHCPLQGGSCEFLEKVRNLCAGIVICLF